MWTLMQHTEIRGMVFIICHCGLNHSYLTDIQGLRDRNEPTNAAHISVKLKK